MSNELTKRKSPLRQAIENTNQQIEFIKGLYKDSIIDKEEYLHKTNQLHSVCVGLANLLQYENDFTAQLEADKAELVKGLKESNELMTMSHEMNLLFPETLDDNLKSQVLCNTDLIQKHAAK